MNKTLLLAGIATTLFAANANAVELNPYVSGKLTYSEIKVDGSQVSNGTSQTADIEDKVYGFNAAVGASTKVPFGSLRGEFEFGYKDGMKDNYTSAADAARGASAIMKADIQTYMFNLYYDIDTGTKFTPYVGAGIGMAHIDAKSNYADPTYKAHSSLSKSANEFAYQLSAGVSYAMNENVSFDLGYRYTDLGSIDGSSNVYQGDKVLFPADMKADFESHEIMLGARYSF